MDINKLLQELYDFDPSLKEHEATLKPVVQKILADKPDTRFDQAFAERLKSQLLASPLRTAAPAQRFARLAPLVGGMVVVGLAVALVVMPGGQKNTPGVRQLSSNAFGSLVNGESGGVVTAKDVAAPTAPQPASANTAMASGRGGALGTPEAMSISVGGGTASAGKMAIFAPYYQYKLVYKGDALELTDETIQVYRRVKPADGRSDLVGSLAGIRFGDFNLNSFGGMSVTSFEVANDDYIINVNAREGIVGVNQNWNTWYPCTATFCPERTPLTAKDQMSDEALIATANEFLAAHGIAVNGYGAPVVENFGQQIVPLSARAEAAPSAIPAYIPESVTVIYPLRVEGNEAVDYGGNKTGLRVTVDIRKQKVSNVWPIQDIQFESSAYAAVTDAKRVISLAERSGNWYVDPAAKVQEVQLGTPTRILLQHYTYTGTSQVELYVPALSFPIVNAPNGYYQKNIVIPLAKELLEQQYGGPVYRTMDKGVSEPAVNTVVPAPTPAVAPAR